MRGVRAVIALVFTLLTACAARSAAPLDTPTFDATYKIRLSMDEVGDRFARTVDYRYTRESVTRRDGKVHEENEHELSLHLEAEFEVIEARDGEATKLKFRVNKFRWSDAEGDARDLLAEGREIVATAGADGRAAFSALDGRLPGNVSEYLSHVVRLPGPKDSSADEVFGTRQPQSVGSAWPVHVDRFVRNAAQGGSTVDPSTVRGEMKLANVQHRDGVLYLLLETAMEFDLKIPMAEDWRQTGGGVRHSAVVRMPADLGAGESRRSAVTETTLRFVRNFGRHGARRESLVDRIVRMNESKTRPLPSAPKSATLPTTTAATTRSS